MRYSGQTDVTLGLRMTWTFGMQPDAAP